MKYKEMLETCARVLEAKSHDADSNHLLVEIEECLQHPDKEKIVIQMNGGLVQNVVSETPIEVLKIEEPADFDDDELMNMYPEDGGSFYQEGAHEVYARTFDADCDPEELQETFDRFNRAAAALDNQEAPSDSM